MNKKYVSIFLVLCLMVSSLLFLPMPVVNASDSYQYIYIRPDNLTTDKLGNWSMDNRAGAFNGKNLNRGNHIASTTNTTFPAETGIVVSQSGQYRVLARCNNLNQAGRWFQVIIDGQVQRYKFSETAYDGWTWDNGFTVNLSAGEHVLQLDGPYPRNYARTDGILITNDPSYMPSNTYDAGIIALEDYQPPVWTDPVLSAENIKNTSLTLRWAGASDNKAIAAYEIVMEGTRLKTVYGEVYAQVTGLEPGRSYTFKVIARDAVGHRTEGPQASFRLNESDGVKPVWPAGSTIYETDVKATSLMINWTAAVDNRAVVSYEVYKSAEKIATVSGNVYSFKVNGLSIGTTYEFKVYAFDEAGNCSESPLVKNVTTSNDVNDCPLAVSKAAFVDIRGNEVSTIIPFSFIKSNVTVKNKTAEVQKCIFVLALFNSSGTMEQVVHVQRDIAPQAEVGISAGFNMPGNTEGYYVKACIVSDLVQFKLQSNEAILR